ncbi:MAG: hypothetical protein RIR11_2875 [Bacteroidota bacterium]|jgi:mannan endo-1,4-beta-mannosidase
MRFLLLFILCSPIFGWGQTLADPLATKRTKALFLNLQKAAAESKILFGHQDDLAYGVGWQQIKGGSDVRFTCGDYPAVYGWELGNLEHDSTANLDNVNFKQMKNWIKEGYERGGVITLSWHMDNYHTAGSAWDTTAAVKDILPGGAKHERYKQDLDRFAHFVGDLKSGGLFNKHAIPVIFRPFHEHTGAWFWWGATHVTPDDFKALWRFTVTYLRDEKKLHQVLYSFSTSYNFKSEAEMLAFYPGDEWVDMLGIDFYANDSSDQTWDEFRRVQSVLVKTAEARGKVPALTEFGFEGIPTPDWWTNVFLKNLLAEPILGRIAYACAWRNFNQKHHYVPYPGGVSATNFQAFFQHPNTLFESDLWNFYKMPKKNNSK